MSEYNLGISCFYHDSAVALTKGDEIISAVQEERFTRIKHDSSFPINSIRYCLNSQFNSLNKKGIQIVNLTIPLQKAAAIENKIGPIWWGDDTHWNSKGIELSAREISRNLNCIKKNK